MTEEQINEVMRLGDVIENLAWSAGKTEQYHDEPTDYAEKLPAARAALEAYLRTIWIASQASNVFPLNPNAASKWAHLQKHDGAEAIGVVFRTSYGSVGSLVDGRVVWADWLAHPGVKESLSIPCGFSLVPDYAGIDGAVSALYRRFSDWSKQGFGADDVTWCEVKADVLAIISMSQVENMAKSVNAELLEALKESIKSLAGYRREMHCGQPCDAERLAVEVIARAESIETPAKVSPCAGRAVQQDADTCRDWPEDFHHENGQYMNTCHVCKNTFIGHKRRAVCKVCNNGFIRAQQEADEAGGA